MLRFIKLSLLTIFLIGLIAYPAMADWVDADGHKMHYPQHPNPNGWDIMCTGNVNLPNATTLGDDWECSETGPVKDLHFWGSWKNGVVGNVVMFQISIHSNIPQGPGGYSIPGPIIWPPTGGPYEVFDAIVLPVDPTGVQGWYDPITGEVLPNDHTNYFQYNVFLPEAMWFDQVQGEIYWLVITAFVDDPINTNWGWKTSIDQHFMDDAVFNSYIQPGDWMELRDPFVPPDPIINPFHIAVDPSGIFMDGFGDGSFPGGEQGSGWWYYPSEWWNVWFYDHPPDPTRMKHFEVHGSLMPAQPGLPAFIEVAINWSTDQWPPTGPEGPPPVPGTFDPQMEDIFIGREIIYVFDGPFFDPIPIDAIYDFLPYNPEWVSIDIRGWNFMFDGAIEHTCLPQVPPIGESLDLAFVITGGPTVGIPTLNEWGMLALLLLLILAGTIALIRKRKPAISEA